MREPRLKCYDKCSNEIDTEMSEPRNKHNIKKINKTNLGWNVIDVWKCGDDHADVRSVSGTRGDYRLCPHGVRPQARGTEDAKQIGVPPLGQARDGRCNRFEEELRHIEER